MWKSASINFIDQPRSTLRNPQSASHPEDYSHMLTKSNATVHTPYRALRSTGGRDPATRIDRRSSTRIISLILPGTPIRLFAHCISPHPEDSTESVISSISSQPRHFPPSLLFPHLVTCLSSFLFPVAVRPHIPVLVYHQFYPSISTCY